MLFNSIDFAIFLPVIFGLYWFCLRDNKYYQNLLIVIASYLFYSWWDWRFLSLILFSTLIDYTVGIALSNTSHPFKRKQLLGLSILLNLGVLFFFKYFNFFLINFINAFTFFGIPINITSLNIILPVGISFYTFQTMSYTIDIYRRKLAPTKDFVAFAAFVSFFPQLVAGPIERASNLLPQFHKKRNFSYDKAADGMRQILWGLFKKIVIANNCAEYVNLIFDNYESYSGSTLLLGAFFFTFQIYGDFSGYSDMAIGIARLFGFDLKQNFAFPYFSRDIAEFWRRWHISLSSWFKDYLYIPLGGSRGSTWLKIRNTFIIFLVSGLWHGANWTFLVWGALNAIYFLPLLLGNKNRKNLDIVAANRLFPSFKEVFQILATFSLTLLAWVFFRAENMTHAINYLAEIFSTSLFSFPEFRGKRMAIMIIILIFFFTVIEWIGREGSYAIATLGLKANRNLRMSFYYLILFLIIFFSGKEQPFIYFKF